MTTWYVANAGNNANGGTDSLHPFQTIAKVVSVALAGDTILLNRGDRWFETLAIPHSSITVDAYGAAAVFDVDGYCTNAPILDQGAAVSGWSSYAGGINPDLLSDTFTGTAGTVLSAHTPTAGTAWTAQPRNPANILLDGSGRATANASINAWWYITPACPSADCYAQVDVIFASIIAGEYGGVATRGTTIASANSYTVQLDSAGTLTLFSIVASVATSIGTASLGARSTGVPYTVKLSSVGTSITVAVNGVTQITVTDSTVTAAGNAGIWLGGRTGNSNTLGVKLDNFSSSPNSLPTPTNTYQATLTTQALVVDHNQAYCFQGQNMNALADQQFYWYQNVLYFRNDAGSPNNSEIIAGQRNNGLSAASFTGLTIQNVAVEHANQASYYLQACAGVLLNACYAQRSSFWNGTLGQNGGIHIIGVSTGATVQNCHTRNTGADGIYFSGFTGPTALYNTFDQLYEIVTNGITIESGGPQPGNGVLRGNTIIFPSASKGYNSNSAKGGIIVFADSSLIEGNFVAYAPLFGISTLCNSAIVRDNVAYRCGSGPFYIATYGAQAGGGGGIRFGTNGGVNFTGTQAYRNLMLECPCGIWGSMDSGHSQTGLVVVNNAIVNLTVVPATQDPVAFVPLAAGGFSAYLSGGNGFGGTFKNNLFWNFTGSGQGGMFFGAESGTFDTDYNLFGPDTTGIFNILGSSYNTLAAYKAGKVTKDQHSISSTPTFSNGTYVPSATPTLTIATDTLLAYRNAWRSPAKDAGVFNATVPPQFGQADMGLEALYGFWGVAA